MLKCVEQISKDKICEIADLYFKNKLSINQIMGLEGMSKNEVLCILNLYKPYYKFAKKELSSFTFSSPSFLVISDTHIGNEDMKMNYLQEVYRLAKAKEISHVFHTGDLIQGTVTGVSKKLKNEEKQISYLIDNYPKKRGIQTHILLGNHDFKTLSKQEYYMSMLKSRSDFDILGFKRCYLNWCKKLLSLNHDITNYRLNLPYVSDTLINFYGHRHDLLIKNNCIYLPTLSNDLKHYGKKEVVPGFILVSKEGNMAMAEHFIVFEKGTTISVNKGIVLKRKI